MKMNRVHFVLVAAALLASAILAEVLAPRELMARSGSLNLENAIPREFGRWRLAPNVQPLAPTDQEGIVDPDAKNGQIYSQEVGRSYLDPSGNLVMLMVAYGPVQNFRL